MGSFTNWIITFAVLLGWFTTLYFIFKRKSGWLSAYSRDSAFFADHVMRKDIHLRQVFHVAIIMEKRGEAFYKSLAEKAAREDTKKLCLRLAEAEIRHRHWIEKRIYQWNPLPIDDKTLPLIENELKHRGVFSNSPGPDATEEEMVEYAVGQEKEFEAFYRAFESAFPEAWKTVQILALATEEMKHAIELVAAYPQFKSLL